MVAFGEAPPLWLHLRLAPPLFYVFWGVASGMTLIALVVATRHALRICAEARRSSRILGTTFWSPQAAAYLKIFMFPPTVAVLTWACLFSLRFSLMFELLVHLYEAAVILWFWELMVATLGGLEAAQQALAAAEPRAVAAAVPLCCLRRVFATRRWTSRDMRLSFGLVLQYRLVAVVAVLSMAISSGVFRVFAYASAASLVACMYGVMMLYACGKEELRPFGLGRKLMLIKLLVLTYKALELIIDSLPVVRAREGHYTQEVMKVAWQALLGNALALLMTVLFAASFSVDELRRGQCDCVRGVIAYVLPHKAEALERTYGRAAEGTTPSSAASGSSL